MSIHQMRRVVMDGKFTVVATPFDYLCFQSTSFSNLMARFERPVTVPILVRPMGVV
jgi:hypothetical protein